MSSAHIPDLHRWAAEASYGRAQWVAHMARVLACREVGDRAGEHEHLNQAQFWRGWLSVFLAKIRQAAITHQHFYQSNTDRVRLRRIG